MAVSSHASAASGGADWLVGGGEIVDLIRSRDWGSTALGPIGSWPESLRTTVSLCLASSFPINVIWGPGCVQIWNLGYSTVCGDKHPAAFGSDYRECWASAWPAIGAAFETARAGETAYLENQPMFLDRNGYLEETWFTFSLSPIRDETGQVAGLFHPVTETTAGMLAERRTRALSDLASRGGRARTGEQAVSHSIEVASSFALDLPLVLLYLVGDQEARLAGHFGLESGQPAAPELVDLLDPAVEWPLAEVIRTGETSQVDDLVGRFGSVPAGPDGASLERALLMPVTLPGTERPAAVLVVGVSTQLPLDESYRSFLGLFAQGVTGALANATAYEREKEKAAELVELDRAKTAFFSNVSHEFRTPLTLMLGPLEDELADGEGAPAALRRERVETAHRNTLRLLRLVNSLLDFSRIESGRLQARYVPTDLAAYTADLASLFRSTTEKAGLELVVACDPLPEPLLVDHEMWEKIVLNLLSNAFKHTFEGRITVGLEWHEDHAELSVSDTGVGIAPDQVPRLFERFHQVKAARSRTFEGSGIGLALVRELARLHGGEVRVESDQDRGSTFTVDVRAGRDHLPAEHIRDAGSTTPLSGAAIAHVDEALHWLGDDDSPDVAEPTDASDTGRVRVLVADDNDDMRKHLRRLLAPHFDVIAVEDGAAALEAARADPPDLVLSDVMMPRLDGFGLLAALREDERTRTVPVIMISARAGEEAASEGITAGADDYLVKPFTAQELVARVSGTIALAHLRRESTLKLEAANRELEAATRAKSRFLASMSHEIRTPMNAILGMTSLMLRSTLSAEQDEQARVIRSSGEHLLNLISDVLDISKIEADVVEIEQAPFSVGGCVQEAVDIVGVAARAKGLELTHSIDRGVPHWVIGDAGRVRQVLINLLTNAVKYTEQGSVTLTVTGARIAGPRTELRFAVRDTGIGIAAGDQAALFNAFTQLDTPAKRDGAGLGLAISARLAKLMGGEISLDSTPGAGSTFELRMWARATAPVQREPPARARGAPVLAAGPLSILVVDDQRANQRVFSRMLEALGYGCDVAGNGSEALEALGRQRYDLVLMDIEMPELDGLSAACMIRERWPRADGPRIVGLTGWATDQARDECLAAGMDDYLAKPVDLDDLAEALAGDRLPYGA